MRFIHAADIHLDSPLLGLESYPGAPADRLRIATRQAFDRVIDLSLEEQVDFLIIAGDLFDTKVKDFHAALEAAAQLRKLDRAGIPVYLILGNHDSRAEMGRNVPWPANVTLFDHKRPQTILHPTQPVALHGMSYPKREVTENLVPDYPAPVPDCFNIGILHTNAGDNSQHAAYAPCRVDELVAKGYDYWALGHVHDYAILHERPHVVYSGNTQGRHAREIGAKGCVIVTVERSSDGNEIQEIEFRETDLARWHRETIELPLECSESDLFEITSQRLTQLVTAADGRLVAVRLEYTGRCDIHSELCRDAYRQQIIAHVRASASDIGDDIWIEKIRFTTQSPLDLNLLRERQDLVGQLLREIDELAEDSVELTSLPEAVEVIAKLSGELNRTESGEEQFQLDDPARRQMWLREAESLLLSHLVQDSGSHS